VATPLKSGQHTHPPTNEAQSDGNVGYEYANVLKTRTRTKVVRIADWKRTLFFTQ